MKGFEESDQDGRRNGWTPHALSSEEYDEVSSWWVARHPGAVETELGVTCWIDWLVRVLHPGDYE